MSPLKKSAKICVSLTLNGQTGSAAPNSNHLLSQCCYVGSSNKQCNAESATDHSAYTFRENQPTNGLPILVSAQI